MLHPCHAGAWGACWSGHGREGQAVHAGDLIIRHCCLLKLQAAPPTCLSVLTALCQSCNPSNAHPIREVVGTLWKECTSSLQAERLGRLGNCSRLVLHTMVQLCPGKCWHMSLRRALRGGLHAHCGFLVQVAEELTHTCWQMYHQMPTGLHAPAVHCSQRKTACCVFCDAALILASGDMSKIAPA